MIGGEHLDDLYITTRSDNSDPTGKLYVARVEGMYLLTSVCIVFDSPNF